MVSLKHTVQVTEKGSSIPEQQASGNTVMTPDGEGEGEGEKEEEEGKEEEGEGEQEGEEKEKGEEGSFWPNLHKIFYRNRLNSLLLWDLRVCFNTWSHTGHFVIWETSANFYRCHSATQVPAFHPDAFLAVF